MHSTPSRTFTRRNTFWIALSIIVVAALAVIVTVNDRSKGQNGGNQPVAGFTGRIVLDIANARTPFNAKLLGSNILWIDNGSNFLTPGTLTLDANRKQLASAIGPTVLRYPGGVEADTYRWRNGTGVTAASRKYNDRYFPLPCAQMPVPSPGGPQVCGSCGVDADCAGGELLACINGMCQGYREQMFFGIREFLTLSRDLGSDPLMTVNIITGTAQEAADLVRYVNLQTLKDENGNSLPKIKYWEIGNEPYLAGDRPGAAITPEEFGRRANAAILAMKAVDPTILVGVPTRNDRLTGKHNYLLEPQNYGGFTARVLATLTEPFDFIAVHNAYLPYAGGSERDQYMAGAVAAELTLKDIDLAIADIRQRRPSWKAAVALTEYSPMFDTSPTPSINSIAGIVATTDLLIKLAREPRMLMANHWSLSGNGDFGAISSNGTMRPLGILLASLKPFVNTTVVPLTVDARTIATTNTTGYVPSATASKSVDALAVVSGQTLRVLAVNKDPETAAALTFVLGSSAPSAVTCQQIAEIGLLTVPTGWKPCSAVIDGNNIRFTAPAASVGVLTITLKKTTRRR